MTDSARRRRRDRVHFDVPPAESHEREQRCASRLPSTAISLLLLLSLFFSFSISSRHSCACVLAPCRSQSVISAVDLMHTTSVLGYSFLPIVLLAFVSLIVPLKYVAANTLQH
jgi:choline-glycine betaine transporter